MLQALLKQFAESVIGFGHRLRNDKFVRTEGAIIAILFFLCVFYLAVVSISSHYLQLAIATEVVGTVSSAIATGAYDANSNSWDLVDRITEIRNSYLTVIALICIIVTILFGFIASKLVLSPTRNAFAVQKKFIGQVAHELRTPLSILTSNHEIALQEYQNDLNVTEMMNSNLEELKRIDDIINNLLNLNSLTNTEAISFEVMNLSDTFVNSTKNLFVKATTKQITITTNLSENVFLLANKEALKKIITSLFVSSLSATPRGGTIDITTSLIDDDTARLHIQDTGTQIKRYGLRRFFYPLYQPRSSEKESKHFGGLNLLVITKLVRQNHGTLSIKTDPKSGTNIVVDFPNYTSIPSSINKQLLDQS